MEETKEISTRPRERVRCHVMRIEINVLLRVRVFVTTINVLFSLPGMLKVKRQWKNNLEREVVATEKSL